MKEEKQAPEDRPIPAEPTPGAGYYDPSGRHGKPEKPQDFQTGHGVAQPPPVSIKQRDRETENLHGLGVKPPRGDEKVTE